MCDSSSAHCVSAKENKTLCLHNLSFAYGRRQVLNDVNVSFSPGIHGLLGPNGAGKTTLLSLLATEKRVQEGTIEILGTGISSLKNARKVRSRIGYCPQQPRLFEDFSVIEMVSYVGFLRGIHNKNVDEEASRAIELVGLKERENSRIRSLSGGMKQRTSLACALVGHPDILILDEPSVGLDPLQRLEFKEILRAYGEAVILLSTHIVDDVAALAQHVTVLSEGKIAFQGATSDLAALGDEKYPGDTPMERGYMNLLGASL